jgi:hypothetical protein
MADISAEVANLRELAAKCRRVAAGLTDENDTTSLRQMAAEYEAMANRMERPSIPNPQPISQ